MKNYYKILEVDEKASKEIIEKAYKVLAKKYHPDLQEEQKKKWAEEMFKEIAESYEILSDDIKREEYDQKLAFEKANNQQKMQQQSTSSQTNLNYEELIKKRDELLKRKENLERNINNSSVIDEELLRKQIEYEKQKAYNDAYIKSLKDRGYKIKYKKTFKDYLAVLITIIISIFIIFILWLIPPTKKIMQDIYQENIIIKIIVDFFIIIGKAILQIFK